MKSEFLTELETRKLKGKFSILISPLQYYSELLDCIIDIPLGFVMDFSSVPRMPIAYLLWGGQCHRESVLHDFLYRKNSKPIVTFMQANNVFLEAGKSRGKAASVLYPMYWGVCVGGYFSYHKHLVMDSIKDM